MIPFDAAHRAVHYPEDRRFRIWICRKALLILLALVILPLAAAWIEGAVLGLPHLTPSPASVQGAVTGPHGFPFWIRWSHFFNLFFLFMLMRSGLSILMDHPRLYWNDHCTPGTEWMRFTPLRVPKDRLWTAKDDARISDADGFDARLSAYRRRGPLLALHHGVRVCADGRVLRDRPADEQPVAAAGAHLAARLCGRVEHVRDLRELPPAAGAQRLLRIQRAAAARVLRDDLCDGAARDPDRASRCHRLW